MKTVKKLVFLLVLVLFLFCLAGCGGGKADSTTKQDTEFLMGSWFAKTASKDGVTVDAYDVFNGNFHLYFSENGECTMAIDQRRAIVKWELTDDNVTLTGDNTYPIRFPDESRKTMIIGINDFEVLMEKYEE